MTKRRTITELGDGTSGWNRPTAASPPPSRAGRLVVGEQGTYRADVEGAETWFWLGQGGQVVPDTVDLNVTPRSPGHS